MSMEKAKKEGMKVYKQLCKELDSAEDVLIAISIAEYQVNRTTSLQDIQKGHHIQDQ